MVTRQRTYNVSVTNVPGPPQPLFLASAPLLELVPVVPITGNLTLGVGALSYTGQLSLIAVADRDTCPDVAVFADGVHGALQSLAASASPVASRPGPTPPEDLIRPISSAHPEPTGSA